MHNLKPKKHLGQHFLTDKNLAAKIVSLLGASEQDAVIEVGPGKGILTDMLKEAYPHLQLIEYDTEAIDYLQQKYGADCPELIHADILKWDFESGLSRDSYFISNLPYNISSPFFFKVLEHHPLIREGVFMIQKEVAERICSPPGKKTYGILSILMGYYYVLKFEFTVPPTVFTPPPRVQSAVIRLTRKEQIKEISFKELKLVVKTAFNQRRKTLRNALKSLPLADFEGKAELLQRRAETLSIEEFVMLTQQLIK